jgi:phosphoglycerate dehydrogenase-like enzyme
MDILLHHIADDGWQRRFAEDFPQHRWSFAFTPEAAERAMPDAEILLITNRACTPELGRALRSGAARLKWMHFLTAGMDRGIAMGLPPDVPVSYSSGVKAAMVSEHAMALLLALLRRLPEIGREQQRHAWMREEISARMRTLEGATVCVVGLGQIGRALTRKLAAFDARIIAVSRSAAQEDGIEEVFSRARLHEALRQADGVVLCTQADAQSFHLMDEAAFAAMKPGGFLVNVARGSLVDETALVSALTRGALAGAALDVQEIEPLPADSPLWKAPNLIVSPHSAGAGSSGYFGYRAVFAENLARLVAGAPLLNLYRAA